MANVKKRQKIRAIELYCKDSPFRHKVERDRTKYSRKTKHKNPRKGDFFCKKKLTLCHLASCDAKTINISKNKSTDNGAITTALAGIALVQKSVDFIKSNINTVQDIRGIVA